MGGGHKKNLRAEKAKVKLKGVKLPKGLNVTKTEFKVRKIQIREQLKASSTQLLPNGQRQVNLKESLNRLKHHSSSMRTEALRSLREAILTAHPSILNQLGEIVQGIANVCLDVEKEARRESFKTLNALLPALPSVETIAPFFHIISSYLRCAMTHIQPALQEDSLLLLDVLLQHVPHLVAVDSAKIFQNFLEMISHARSEGKTPAVGRTLSVNMSQTQTTVKWRFKVLHRLNQMLHTLKAYKQNYGAASIKNNGNEQVIRTFSSKEPQYYSLKASSLHGTCDISSLLGRNVAENGTSHLSISDVDSQASTLGNYIEHLMPLLLETWLEVRPQSSSLAATKIALLSTDAAETLRVTLEIIQSLWSLVDMHELEVNNKDLSLQFQREYADSFANNFLLADAFPYQQNEKRDEQQIRSKSKSKKQAKEATTDPHCLQQNICLSYLMCRFFTNNTSKESAKFAQLLSYLLKMVNNLKMLSMEHHSNPQSNCHQHLEQALREVLLKNGATLLQTDAKSTRSLLRATITAFLNSKFAIKDGTAAKILVLLCEIVQTPHLLTAYGFTEFSDFLEYLPQLLLKPAISETALLAMSDLGKQKNEIFLQSLSTQILGIIENIQRIQIIGAANAFEGKKPIMNLFYWLDKTQWHLDNMKEETTNQIEQLQKKIDEHVTDKRIVSYFKFILTQA